MNTTEFRCWTAIAEVVPQASNADLGGANGAYVAVAGLSDNEVAFRDLVSTALGSMGFDVVELDDVEMLQELKQLNRAKAEMQEKIKALTAAHPFEYGTFHSYRSD